MDLGNPHNNLIPLCESKPIPPQPDGRKKLGQTLTEHNLIPNQELALGLNVQRRFRKKRLGEIFVDNGVVTYEKITRALSLKNSLEADAKLGAILVAGGLISHEDLNIALIEQKKLRGRRLGEILVDMGVLDSEILALALALQCETKYVDLKRYPVEEFECRTLSPKLLRRLKAFPISFRKNELTVVVADPNNLRAEADLRFHTGLRIKVAGVSSEKAIMEAIDKNYGTLSQKNLAHILHENTKTEVEKIEDLEEEGHFITEEVGREQPIVEIVNHILKTAVVKRASDIHIIPEGKTAKVRFRIDGILYDELSFQKERLISITNRMKILSGMDIAERRLPRTEVQKFGFMAKLWI